MNRVTALLVLLCAAALEAGGDALVRRGLHVPSLWTRVAFLLCGGIVLFAYGVLVNTPPWDFGRLLGIYVVFFFVVAQLIAWLAFGQPPTRQIWLGGACIVLGGLILSFGA
jgi:drug/metabolite transporter (DMT)-like permease